MKELIKRWCENPNEISLEDAILVLREYCKLYGNREISDDELKILFHIHQNMIPIRFDKLIKCICIYYEYNIIELWSKPDVSGNRKLIRCYFDD